MSSSITADALSLEDMTTASESSSEESDYSDEEPQSSCVESDLQDMYESFDFDDDTPVPSKSAPSLEGFRFEDVPLYEEARLTSLQSSLLLFQYAIRHSLTTKAFTELLQLVSVHVPRGAAIPKSVYQLKQSFIQAFPDAEAKRHYYCETCKGAAPCDCDFYSPTSFITIPLGPQVKKMMEDPDTWSALQARFKRPLSAGVLKDVCDGEGYKEHWHFLSQKANISLLLNTDGVAIYRSSKISIWPVWAAVNEMPPSLRFLRKHLLLLAIFYSKDKPVINMFLRPIIDEINVLYREGIVVNTPEGVLKARAILLMCSADLPARAILMNMKQWNGAYGCLYCESSGSVLPGDHLHRYWPYNDTASKRSHSSIMENAEEATRAGSCVQGIKGPTVLALHPRFNLVSGVVIDDLHGIFLGITLSLLYHWFDRKNRGKPYFIGSEMSVCDQRLLAIKVTDTISRVPRSLQDFSHWKGAELRNWLLFFSIPVLKGILPANFLNHLALLVTGVFIFSSQSIERHDFVLAQQLLLQFCKDFSVLYGIKASSMNVHMMQHLPDCVKMWGPLWAYSTFHFENANGYLKYLFHGTRDMTKQMAFSYVVMQGLPATQNVFHKSPSQVSTIADILYGHKRLKKQTVDEGINVLGGVALKPFGPNSITSVEECLHREGLGELPGGPLPTAYRVEINGSIYYSRQYDRVTKRNSFTVSYRNSTTDESLHFAFIECFIFVNNNILAVLNPLSILPETYNHFNLTRSDLCNHIFHVSATDDVVTITASRIVRKCMYIDFSSNKYVVIFPSVLMFD